MGISFSDTKDAAESAATLRELENIDDEAEEQDIQFVKIADAALAAEYGVHQLPALVYFEDKNPSVYDGTGCLSLVSVQGKK